MTGKEIDDEIVDLDVSLETEVGPALHQIISLTGVRMQTALLSSEVCGVSVSWLKDVPEEVEVNIDTIFPWWGVSRFGSLIFLINGHLHPCSLTWFPFASTEIFVCDDSS